MYTRYATSPSDKHQMRPRIALQVEFTHPSHPIHPPRGSHSQKLKKYIKISISLREYLRRSYEPTISNRTKISVVKRSLNEVEEETNKNVGCRKDSLIHIRFAKKSSSIREENSLRISKEEKLCRSMKKTMTRVARREKCSSIRGKKKTPCAVQKNKLLDPCMKKISQSLDKVLDFVLIVKFDRLS